MPEPLPEWFDDTFDLADHGVDDRLEHPLDQLDTPAPAPPPAQRHKTTHPPTGLG